MQALGCVLLLTCALLAAVGSLAAEFSPNHVYNEGWPRAARQTCARCALLNVGLALVSLALLASGAPLLAASLLLLEDFVMLATCLLPEVDIIAEGERVIGQLPLSYWFTFAHLALVVLGAWLSATGA